MKASQQRVARARPSKIPQGIHAPEHGLFFSLLKRDGLPLPETEWPFAMDIGRRWRFDFAWHRTEPADAKRFMPTICPLIALEVEGGVWTRGRHTRGSGFLKDCEKYNEAAVRGWRLLRVTPSQLCTLETVALIRRALSL